MFNQLVTLFIVLAIVSLTSGFLSSPFSRSASKMILKECEDRYKDKNGRCPDQSGYIPFAQDAPEDFAAYQKQLKEKKAAEAAKKAAEKK
mmetsp:Transcript_11537/g.10463  ORF Transcript_11537/g.10463 Transcript_11537/m.10463 type:complete len:90 (-) Transcript_11537:35-304(-)